MAIRRYKATADNTIANGYQDNLETDRDWETYFH